MTAFGRFASYVFLSVLVVVAGVAGLRAEPRDPQTGLQDVQRTLEEQRAAREAARREAAALSGEIEDLRGRLVASARAIRDLEGEAMVIEARIQDIERTAQEGNRRLAGQQQAYTGAISAMVRLARFPPEAVIALPLSPGDVVRAAIAVRATVPMLADGTRSLRSDLADIARARAEARERKKALDVKLARLDRERKDMDGMLAKRRELQRAAAVREKSIDSKVDELSTRAKDLQDLLERVERERREQAAREAEARAKAEAQARARAEAEALRRMEEDRRRAASVRSIGQAKGNLAFPVAGRVVGLYGQMTSSGLARKGVEIESRAGAQVVAPFDGEVAFAGPFRGYGRILIIDHGEGYHSLLAGLDQIDGIPGHRIVAGEPIGRMGRLGASAPVLYLEFRRDGQPINPLPWLARNGHGVNG